MVTASILAYAWRHGMYVEQAKQHAIDQGHRVEGNVVYIDVNLADIEIPGGAHLQDSEKVQHLLDILAGAR